MTDPGFVRGLVADMAALEFWLTAAAIAVAALFLLRGGTRAFWRLRTITDTPTARIRTAPQGCVELTGFAHPHQRPVTSRLTSAPCVWFRYRIEKRQRVGRGDKWVTVEEDASERAFLLDDGSGRCLVQPAGAHFRLNRRQQWLGSRRDPRSRAASGWLGFGSRYRFTEERIEEGDPVYLLGRFETPRRGPEERERLARALLRVWKRDPAQLGQFDTNGDGTVSIEEWEDARARAAELAERTEDRLSREPALSQVLDTGDPRHPFVISTVTEEALTSHLRWQAFGLTAAFLALAVLAGYGLVLRLSLA